MRIYKFKRPTFIDDIKSAILTALLKNKHKKNSITLKHNTIYVLPSTLGVYFSVVASLNFVMGINYQNNLILFMAYLMFVIIIFALLLGYSNARGLTVSFKYAIASFAPQTPQLVWQIEADDPCQSITLSYPKDLKNACYITRVKEVIKCQLSLPYTKRGCYKLKPIKIASNYPFGLVSVWSYIQPNKVVYVYPSIIKTSNQKHQNLVANNTDEGTEKHKGDDEFESLITHLPEMGLQRISWKHYAKTQQLLVKQFSDFKSADAQFDFNLVTGDTEERLGQLCFLVCQAFESDINYSLKLPNNLIACNSGKLHHQRCLEALSLVGDDNE
ncbi:hypothetical protein QMA05_00385 [Pseudoalteromonas sp. APC 4026]|jgi:hypothetical protein|nr:hypothetical protein [Pseudoalteromonas sp. APC 4026]TMS61176.1 hypothetical protein CWC10_13275 [Pseudoalteromonas sp. S3173]